ncbi:MAG: peptide/nickel transport system permease protein [Actinomycetota bacterium]|jgi:ABC-type dipeptide/oligopeptide/nickel transport system permease subunit|nr:peptide/nickel transport system permease protein [Actinomycetota bacterium]
MSQVASDTGFQGQPSAGEPSGEVTGKTPGQLFWARFKTDRVAFVGLGVIVLLIVLALSAGLIAEHVTHRGPNDLSLSREMRDDFGLPKGPNGTYLFGADTAGRDLFIRVIYGTRTSLQVAIVATGISVFIGVVLGMTAGFFGGKVDTIISRTIDVILSLPLLVFALGIAAACGTTKEGCFGGYLKPGLGVVVFIIAAFSWPYIARIVRGNTLSLREKEFVEAARSLGASNRRIMFREVLPNLIAPILVYSTLIIPSNIIFEAALSFLGLGVPQHTPSWGRMLSEAARNLEGAPWMMAFPVLFLVMTTLAFNLLGDGLRDALDPRADR